MLIFGVYLLIRRRAVLRYIRCPPSEGASWRPLRGSQICGYYNIFSSKSQVKKGKKISHRGHPASSIRDYAGQAENTEIFWFDKECGVDAWPTEKCVWWPQI